MGGAGDVPNEGNRSNKGGRRSDVFPYKNDDEKTRALEAARNMTRAQKDAADGLMAPFMDYPEKVVLRDWNNWKEHILKSNGNVRGIHGVGFPIYLPDRFIKSPKIFDDPSNFDFFEKAIDIDPLFVVFILPRLRNQEYFVRLVKVFDEKIGIQEYITDLIASSTHGDDITYYEPVKDLVNAAKQAGIKLDLKRVSSEGNKHMLRVVEFINSSYDLLNFYTDDGDILATPVTRDDLSDVDIFRGLRDMPYGIDDMKKNGFKLNMRAINAKFLKKMESELNIYIDYYRKKPKAEIHMLVSALEKVLATWKKVGLRVDMAVVSNGVRTIYNDRVKLVGENEDTKSYRKMARKIGIF